MAARNWKKPVAAVVALLLVLAFVAYRYAPFISTYLPDDKVQMGAVLSGTAAPDFELPGADGKTHRLSDYRGRKLVLEWTSPRCEFTAKHYASGNMQALQKRAVDKGVVWLLVNSGAKGSDEYLDAAAAQARITSTQSAAQTLLIDGDGRMGLRYGALTTPSVFLIDEAGVLRYQGAVDDGPWASGTLDPAHNFVLQALDALAAGKPVAPGRMRPYGCGVKYNVKG
jgi:peroxiredoxin